VDGKVKRRDIYILGGPRKVMQPKKGSTAGFPWGNWYPSCLSCYTCYPSCYTCYMTTKQ